MKALVLQKPGQASIETIPDPVPADENVLLKVRMVGFCGSDLNSFRGLNPLVSFPRILGHEVSATIVGGRNSLPAGTDVALSPYTSCGQCASCRRGRPNACQLNQTLGVQRDGALTEFIVMPAEKLYAAKLTPKELCLVEPLTVGFHAVDVGELGSEPWLHRTVVVQQQSVLMWMTISWNLHSWQAALTRLTRRVSRCMSGCRK